MADRTVNGKLPSKMIASMESGELSGLPEENPDFFRTHSPRDLGQMATAAFQADNRQLLYAISQYAFDTMAASSRGNVEETYIALYRQTEDYLDSLPPIEE